MRLSSAVLALLPEHVQKELKPCPPYATNYQVSLRFTATADVYHVKDVVTDALAGHSIVIKGLPVKCALESSPQRRVAYGAYFAGLRELQQLDGGNEGVSWMTDGRALTIVNAKSFDTIGRCSEGLFLWADDRLLEIGLTIRGGRLARVDPSTRERRTKRRATGGAAPGGTGVEALAGTESDDDLVDATQAEDGQGPPE